MISVEPPDPTSVAVQPPTTYTQPTQTERSITATPTSTPVDPTATATPVMPTLTPTIIPTPPPTLTMAPTPTVEPTLTAQPTAAPPPVTSDVPRIVLERPVEGMFLQSPPEISGTVDVADGQVRVVIQTPDGKDLGLEPVVLPTEPNGNGLNFRGTIPLGHAPTPRGVVIVVEYLDREGNVRATTQQRTNVEGRFARLQYIVVEAPLPYSNTSEPTILVHGAAAGPPAAVEVRLLDATGNVLVSKPAALGWYQQGLPCDFSATIENRPEGTTIEVVGLDPGGQILERMRVPLAAR